MRILLMVALLASSSLALAAATDAQRQVTEAQIETLKRQVAALERSIDSREGKQKTLEQALREAEQQIGDVSRELSTLNADLASLDANLEGLETRAAELERQLSEGRAIILQLLREQYQQGRQPQLQLMLSERDPARAERLLHYYDHLNADLAQRLKTHQEQLQALGETRASAGATTTAIQRKRESLAAQELQLKAAQAKRSESLAALKAALKEDRGQLSRLKTDQKQLEVVLAGIQKALEKARLAESNKAFSTLKGKLPWPVSGQTLRSFGSTEHDVRYEGVLISARPGEVVRAVHGGRVVFADWLRGYGLLLIIDHGGGYMSLYGHNQSLMRETGAKVQAGETVAVVGNSGGYDATGLYFAIRHKGSSIDPGPWLARR